MGDTLLFDNIYAPFATRTSALDFATILHHVEESGNEYTVTEADENTIAQIEVFDSSDSGDIVLFAFLPDETGQELIMSVSFLRQYANREVSLSNYSPDRAEEYDKLSTHVIGEAATTATDIHSQKAFLFGVGVTPAPVISHTPEPFELDFELAPTLENGKLVVEVITNLPVGTRCMLQLENESAGYKAQSSVELSAQSIPRVTFSANNDALPAGVYDLSFNTAIYAVQPDAVKAVIGNDYENLISDLKSVGSIGTVIRYNMSVHIEDGVLVF